MMLRSKVGAALAAAALLAACGGTTQEQTTPTPATTTRAATTVLGDLLKDWQDQKDMMLKIADAMLEDKFGYKSAPPQRSYGEQVMHVATVNVDILEWLGGKTPAPSFTVETAKTKADMLKAMADSDDYGTACSRNRQIPPSRRPSMAGSSARRRAPVFSGFYSGTRWTSTARWSCIFG